MAVWDRFSIVPAAFAMREQPQEIDPRSVPEGISHADDWIIFRGGGEIRVYDRICDHNGGRLIFNNGRVSCPMHGWELDAATGRYKNVECTKVPLVVAVDDPASAAPVRFALKSMSRSLAGYSKPLPVEIEFLNHACLIIRTEGLSFATDPWLLGPAFCNGWWLALPSPAGAFEKINACDFLYISHNHPDHLHRETLERVRKDMPILTPAFDSGSTARYLEDLGFVSILAAPFDAALRDDVAEISLSVLKSGDFRDDSGLLVEIGGFSALLAVDANFIDFYRFPEGLTVFASSFASGASGFPLCFDNYDERERQQIIIRNRNTVRYLASRILEKTAPVAFLPYAGFFSEAAPRDSYIKEHNRKNAVSDYSAICEDLGVRLLDVIVDTRFLFEGRDFRTSQPRSGAVLDQAPMEAYLAAPPPGGSALDPAEVATYFLGSGYAKPLNLLVRLTDDAFEEGEEAFFCRFDEKGPGSVTPVSRADYEAHLLSLDRFLSLRIRRSEFIRVIRLGLPWEDLSIGFQCRVKRQPNIYHSDFWYHFSNVYVNDKVKRASLACDACINIQHEFVV
uniref:Rieske 2Fe-2S domain-containing protein n=1 Tax=Pannonibacter phragmitetus TaxID=121719 RepID=UPI000B966DCD|nr:Rieske 2Fe-2S domain-containing protein [Pannonibacter phragmitetus]